MLKKISTTRAARRTTLVFFFIFRSTYQSIPSSCCCGIVQRNSEFRALEGTEKSYFFHLMLRTAPLVTLSQRKHRRNSLSWNFSDNWEREKNRFSVKRKSRIFQLPHHSSHFLWKNWKLISQKPILIEKRKSNLKISFPSQLMIMVYLPSSNIL